MHFFSVEKGYKSKLFSFRVNVRLLLSEMRSIAVDIGNTRIKAGLFLNGNLSEDLIIEHDRLKDLSAWLKEARPTHLIYSSTAAESFDISGIIPAGVEVLKLNAQIPVPIAVDYDRSTLGQDRLANAVAGHSLDPNASLVIDAGTCVTYDWTIAGTYIGGSIAPGMHMRLQAMHQFTGRLPLIEELHETDLIGKDTVEAMSSGAIQGMILEIKGVISEFHARYPQGSVYLTGGDAALLAEPIENDIFADPLLTLVGCNAILEHNA